MKSLIVVCMVLLAVSAQDCPKTDLSEKFSDDKQPYHPKTYVGNREAEKMFMDTIGEEAVENMKKAAECAAPVLTDILLPAATVCEPCPHREYHLYSFNNNRCKVIFPQYQRVRYVRCSYRSCQQFCPCHSAYCRTSSWHMSWFFAYCTQDVGSWHKGFNYHYLWLPQDCKCQAFHWITAESSDTKKKN